jgi:hypothetical protein
MRWEEALLQIPNSNLPQGAFSTCCAAHGTAAVLHNRLYHATWLSVSCRALERITAEIPASLFILLFLVNGA